MQRERKGTGIIIVIFALAAMLTTEWISNLAREKNLRNPTQIVSTTSLPNDKKHAAFLAARASVLADLAGPGTAVSAPENQAGFRETPTENYIALRVEITDNHNQRVRENWIVGLEPDTNVVRSKVKEEAAATGTPGQ